MPRDYSKYRFNGESYPKGRLVLAVVKAYIKQNKPNLNQLREAFPKDLQGSIGVFLTEQEYNARKQSSKDKSERFFKKPEDRLATADGEQILICTEWGKDNVSQFVEHSNDLGFDISLEPSNLSDEIIIENFVHKPAFKRNYKNWPKKLLGNFCDLMRSANEAGLDIFTVDMPTGGSIRIGRRNHEDKKAKEVFATLEPCKSKINFVRNLRDKPPLIGELNDELLEQVRTSDDFQKFAQEYPISRDPLLPTDYQYGSYTENAVRIWKVSHSPKVLKDSELEWLSDNQLLGLHQNTGNGSVPCFEKMSKGDIVSLGYGNTVFKLVRITSDIEIQSDSPLGEEWLLRRYDVIKELEEPTRYDGRHTRWSPRFSGTSWEVPEKEYPLFEQEILVPYFDLTLSDIGIASTNVDSDKSADLNLNIGGQKATPMNQILYGPPGTGKTYRTVQMAVEAAEPTFKPTGRTKKEVRNSYQERYDKLTSEGRIRFVTFHQSYGYEEFVEGLSAKTEGDQLSYFEKDGIFKTICGEAQKFRVANKVSAGEEFDEHWEQFSQTLAESESGIKIKTLSKNTYFTVTDVTNNTIRFDKSKGKSVHTLSVKTLRAIYNGEKVIKGGLQPYYGALIEYLNQIAVQTSDMSRERKHFVLIIDEINRGNISKIFGELITLVEPSKRLGQQESLEVILPYSGDPFTVPDNLYLIGTMNTADRSLALMDTALRRRFDFVEVMPDYSALRDDNDEPYCVMRDGISINLVELLQTLNNRISALYDREHTLGHAFLMPVIDEVKADNHSVGLEELAKCFQNKIIPLLAEYFFEDWQKIRLVLGDNQKEQKHIAQLIERSMVQFDSLFGDTSDHDLMADEAHDYHLVEPDSPLWLKPETYVGMYDLSELTG